ncbi:MAG: permease-like cell division protein FtsX [Bacteroidales bacterium]|nr:permease-like cell division protein FtsX [Bacteroidales bacterium]
MAHKENKIMRRRLANAYLSSLVSISLVLLLVGIAALLLINSKNVSDYFKKNMRMSVMYKPEVTEQQALEHQPELNSMPFVATSEFISRERGEQEMKAMLGEDFLSVFETSPVPVSVDITLKPEYVTADSLEVVTKAIGKSKLVEEVVFQKTLIDALNTNLGRISAFLMIAIVLLLFVSSVLIGNTIRLNVYDKRFTVHTMKLVGATKGFIRKPFLVKSAFMGLFAALIAIIMLVALLFVLKRELPQLFELFTPGMLLVVMGIVIASGLLICVVSTYFLVGKLVSLDKSELYY